MHKYQLARLTSLLLLSGASGIGLPAAIYAHPGHDHEAPEDPSPPALRLWIVAGRKIPLSASFIIARASKVYLRDRTGRLIVVEQSDLSADDQAWLRLRQAQIQALNRDPASMRHMLVMAQALDPVERSIPTAAAAFQRFQKLNVSWDEDYLYVESDGMPDHPMMKGIRNWQQQVPLPQPYRGNNAWRIPLQPRLAEQPISARTALFRGAIALAVNGVPIFNALNNRGEDAYLAGELDDWGGHCGRADDYHYHIAPLHLQEVVGKGRPIAYALDGFPLYGDTDPDGAPVDKLDEYNGRFGNDGTYRYHATKAYPYINGGLRGVVEVRGDQVEPQPRSMPIRPHLLPLREATITAFHTVADNHYRLEYEVRQTKHAIEYRAGEDGAWQFTFEDEHGQRRTETYRREDRHASEVDRPPRPLSEKAGFWLLGVGACVLLGGVLLRTIWTRSPSLHHRKRFGVILLIVSAFATFAGAILVAFHRLRPPP